VDGLLFVVSVALLSVLLVPRTPTLRIVRRQAVLEPRAIIRALRRS